MTIWKACLRCAKPSDQSYCEKHRRKPWENSERGEYSSSISPRLRQQILEVHFNTCYLCDKQEATEVDHRIPVSEGGTDDEYNLAPICSKCHKQKTAEESQRARARNGHQGATPGPISAKPGGVTSRSRQDFDFGGGSE